MLGTMLLTAVIVLLIAGIAFFASSETAFLSLTKVHLKAQVHSKVRGAKKALHLFDNMDSLLSLLLIGTNFLDAVAASLSTSLAAHFGGAGVLAATLLTTAAITIFGEIVPKTFAITHADRVAFIAAPILIVLQKLLSPVMLLFSIVSRAASYLAAHIISGDREGVTEADIMMMIDVGTAEGTLEKNEREMIYRIFTLEDIHVRSFMRHRSLVVSVSQESSMEEIRCAFAAGYSHIPVMNDNDVVGVLSYMTVLFDDNASLSAPRCDEGAVMPYSAMTSIMPDISDNFVLRNMTPPLFVPETHSAASLLERFKDTGEDFAVVLDERGAFSGIVTMNSLTSVVFAHMASDRRSPLSHPSERVQVISGTECIIPGDMRIEDASELLGISLASNDFNTIGGWLLEHFGYLPSIGEVYVEGDTAFVVEDQARRRILSIRVKHISTPSRPIPHSSGR